MTESKGIIEKRGPAIETAVTNFAKGLEGLAGTPKDKLDESLDNIVKALVDELKGVEGAIKKDDIDDGAKDFNSVFRTQQVQQAVSQVMNPMYDLTSALRESVGSIIRDDSITDKSARVRESVDQFKDAVMGLVAMVEEVVGADDGGDDTGDEEIEKRLAVLAEDVAGDDVVKSAAASIEMGLMVPPNVDQHVDLITKGEAIAVTRDFLAGVHGLLVNGEIAKRDHAPHLEAIAKSVDEIVKAAGALGKATKHEECGPLAATIAKCSDDIMKAHGALGGAKKDPAGKVEKADPAGDGTGNSAGPGSKEGHVAEDPKAGAAGEIKKMFEDINKSIGEQLAKTGEQIAEATKQQIAAGNAEIAKSVAELTERVTKLEGKPQPTAADGKTGGGTQTVEKAEDGAKTDVKKAADAPDALSAMRLAQSDPTRIHA